MVDIHKNKIFAWHLISSGFTEVSDDVSAVSSSAEIKGWAFYASFSEKAVNLLPIILAQWHGSISNDFRITRHVSLTMLFFSPS